MPMESDWQGALHVSAAGIGLAQGCAHAHRPKDDLRPLKLITSSIPHTLIDKMPVPYGFGVGDFVAVGTLAWRVYRSC